MKFLIGENWKPSGGIDTNWVWGPGSQKRLPVVFVSNHRNSQGIQGVWLCVVIADFGVRHKLGANTANKHWHLLLLVEDEDVFSSPITACLNPWYECIKYRQLKATMSHFANPVLYRSGCLRLVGQCCAHSQFHLYILHNLNASGFHFLFSFTLYEWIITLTSWLVWSWKYLLDACVHSRDKDEDTWAQYKTFQFLVTLKAFNLYLDQMYHQRGKRVYKSKSKRKCKGWPINPTKMFRTTSWVLQSNNQ
jgi:hypothetical protein